MLIFALLICFLVDSLIYMYASFERKQWEQVNAEIVSLKEFKNSGTSKSGYSFSIDFLLVNSPDKEIITQIYGISNRERRQFVNDYKMRKAITVWFRASSNQVNLFAPVEPQLFSWMLILLPTLGIASVFVSIFIFGERIKKL